MRLKCGCRKGFNKGFWNAATPFLSTLSTAAFTSEQGSWGAAAKAKAAFVLWPFTAEICLFWRRDSYTWPTPWGLSFVSRPLRGLLSQPQPHPAPWPRVSLIVSALDCLCELQMERHSFCRSCSLCLLPGPATGLLTSLLLTKPAKQLILCSA